MIARKAQTDKALTFPVLILLLIVLAAFLFLASMISFTAPTSPEAESSAHSSDLLKSSFIQTVQVELTDGTTRRMYVYDALTLSLNQKVKKIDFRAELNAENNCYLLVDRNAADLSISNRRIGSETSLYGYRFNPSGEPIEILTYIPYESKLDEAIFFTQTYTKKLRYYYGPC